MIYAIVMPRLWENEKNFFLFRLPVSNWINTKNIFIPLQITINAVNHPSFQLWSIRQSRQKLSPSSVPFLRNPFDQSNDRFLQLQSRHQHVTSVRVQNPEGNPFPNSTWWESKRPGLPFDESICLGKYIRLQVNFVRVCKLSKSVR